LYDDADNENNRILASNLGGGGGMDNWVVTADNEATGSITDGVTLDFAGGEGISTSYSSATVTSDLDITSLAQDFANGLEKTDEMVIYNGAFHRKTDIGELMRYFHEFGEISDVFEQITSDGNISFDTQTNVSVGCIDADAVSTTKHVTINSGTSHCRGRYQYILRFDIENDNAGTEDVTVSVNNGETYYVTATESRHSYSFVDVLAVSNASDIDLSVSLSGDASYSVTLRNIRLTVDRLY